LTLNADVPTLTKSEWSFSPVIEFQLSRTGILFLISAPSGGGKSSVLRALLEHDSTLAYSISATTRPPRKDEQDGREYHFKTPEQFQQVVDRDGFLEHAIVHGHRYGTLQSEIESRVSEGLDVILDVDVQGSLAIKENRPDTVSIFILPPSIATLEKRLRNRGTDDEDQLRMRIENARDEIRYASLYDYVIVNEQLPRTIEGIEEIIKAERRKGHRMTVTDALGIIEFINKDDALSSKLGD